MQPAFTGGVGSLLRNLTSGLPMVPANPMNLLDPERRYQRRSCEVEGSRLGLQMVRRVADENARTSWCDSRQAQGKRPRRNREDRPGSKGSLHEVDCP